MHVKNGKVIWQEWKWLLAKEGGIVGDSFLFCKFLFNDVVTLGFHFFFFKRTKKKKKKSLTVQENTPWEQSQAHRCFA